MYAIGDDTGDNIDDDTGEDAGGHIDDDIVRATDRMEMSALHRGGIYMASDAAQKSRKPPSQERYERTHPKLTCRVTAETKERLQAILRAQGVSLGKWLEQLVHRGGESAAVVNAREAYTRGFDDGFAAGHDQAWDDIVEFLYELLQEQDCKGDCEVFRWLECASVKKGKLRIPIELSTQSDLNCPVDPI
ncbi:MAG: hypothetical protein ACPLPR_03390 [Bacillota bacterium]